MSPAPLLLPNLGAEEGEGWRQTLRVPRVATAARLWRWLFPRAVRVAGDQDANPPIAWHRWPDALETGRDAPAFEWLGEAKGCIPWLGDAAARGDPAAAGLPFSGPAPEVVAHVHDKAFAWRAAESAGLVPRSLRGTARIFEPSELDDAESALTAIRAALDDWPDWTRGHFTLKPRFGTSGRGRCDGRADDLDAASLAAAFPRLARRGGAVLEPWVDKLADLSGQVRVSPVEGTVLLGSLELLTGPSGGYRGHAGEIDSRGRIFSGLPQDEAVREATGELASLARERGFHGPAGLDALVYRDARDGEPILRPCVEWNARFTMGSVVLGLVRRLLPRLRSELDLGPGERRAFVFCLDAPAAGWEESRDAAGAPSLLVPLSFPGDALEPALLFAAERSKLAGFSSTLP